MFKRVSLFLLTNILIVATISIVTSLLGVKPYLTAQGINYESLLIFCLLWGMGGSFISLLISKMMAKMAMGVQIVELNGPYHELVATVHRLAKKAGITKMPEVGIYNSPEVNAFATGPSKNNSLVAVSTGLLEQMNQDEVEGVLAHEVAHAANGDMVTMTLVQGVVNAFVMFFSRVITFAISQALKDEEGRGGLGFFAQTAVIFVLDILFTILSKPIVMWFSRYREYKADAGGAELAGKQKMIAALESLVRYQDRIMTDDSNMGTLKIADKQSIMALFSSHPPLEKRIQALKTSN
ncbi:protease HtpX [Halobacteriovorax sp. GB3]|uniref:protease HtpX n=1 Tax=Halobacteriovorax sp. GB3 TaxID=2719615 RepID=UPI00235E9157|nr:protease HtpX [Halobacteriovorax sp. GB3]MDD0852899.1 protease HtpX [Halobacteriovorax sp. GB3]